MTTPEPSRREALIEETLNVHRLEIQQYLRNIVNLGEAQVKDFDDIFTKLFTKATAQLEAEAYERGREDAFGEATKILLSTIKRDTPTT
jgi:hypothetical protein